MWPPAAQRHGARFTLVERGAGLSIDQFTLLRETMWAAAGPVRVATAMVQAMAQLDAWGAAGWEARIAHLLLAAALRRPRNLGAHWRDDAYLAPQPNVV